MTDRDPADRSDPEDVDTQREIDRLETLAHVLDDVFRVPGTRIRFGLDGVIGLIPGVGDAATGALAAYLALRARQLGLPASVAVRMAANVGLDLAAGSIPVAGDLFDIAFKANRRNIELLKRELANRAPAQAKNVTPASGDTQSRTPDWRSRDPD
jgi:C4-dicarboxylate transporter